MDLVKPDASTQREIAAKEFARTNSIAGACKKSGLTRDQFYRLRKDPTFQDRVNELRSASMMTLASKVIAAANVAADKLLQYNANQIKATPSQVRAWRIALELAPRYHEIRDLHPRLRHVEEVLNTQGTPELPAHQEPGDPGPNEPIDVEVLETRDA